MEPHEIATWMREEHQKVSEVATRLRQQVASMPTSGFDEWITVLRDEFDHLRAHLRKHFVLEEHEGYMNIVLKQRPTLSAAVGRLRHEHTELIQLMDKIHRAVHQLAPEDRLLIRDCCHRIDHFLSYVEYHEEQENLIVMSVFTDDLGTRD